MAKKKKPDVTVSHGVPELIKPGTYLWQVTRVEVSNKFMNTRKAYIRGVIVPPSSHTGIELYMVCNLPQKVGVRSKFYESCIIANWGQRPARKDRLSSRMFKDAIFNVEVRTVAKNEKGEARGEAFHYSVVDHLIERVA